MNYPPQGPYGQVPQGQYPQQPFQGQPGYPGYPQPPKKSGTGLVIGLVVAGLVVVVLAVGGYFFARASKAARIEAECADRGPTSSCLTHGTCALNDDGTGCIAAKASDCRASKICKEKGKCGFSFHACNATSAADCAASTDCAMSGNCDVYLSECRPSSALHCSRSTLCLNLNSDCVYDSAYHDCREKASTSSSSSGGTPTYTCRSGCTYIGGGKCRCPR
jgi:hypothetical protein